MRLCSYFAAVAAAALVSGHTAFAVDGACSEFAGAWAGTINSVTKTTWSINESCKFIARGSVEVLSGTGQVTKDGYFIFSNGVADIKAKLDGENNLSGSFRYGTGAISTLNLERQW